jgi:branched-chain amino acid transport system substrate-binding protein
MPSRWLSWVRGWSWFTASILLTGIAPAQEAVVRIGHVAPMSGWLARVGADSANGARLAVEALNRQGVTIGGRQVVFELVQADDAGDMARAVAAGRSLVDARVSGVVGHLLSDATIAGGAVYAAAGIPQVAPSATRVAYTRQGWNTAFRVIADDAHIGRLLARYLVDARKATRLVVIDDRGAFGAGLADEFSNEALARGAQVLDRIRVDESVSDFADVLSRARSAQPDAIFFGGFDRQAGLILKQMRRLGINATFVGGDAICTPDLVSYWAAGAALDDQVLCALPAGVGGIGGAAMAEFSANYRKRFGNTPEFYAPFAFDAVMVLADAMVRAESSAPADVRRALAQTREFRGLTGIISFDEQGDVHHPAVSIFTYRAEVRQPVTTIR